MEIFTIILIIIGIIVTIISSIIFASSSSIIRDKKNWADFVKKADEKGLPVSEDELYKLTCKVNSNACMCLIIGLIIMTLGVMLRLLVK